MGRKKLVRILLECATKSNEWVRALNLQRETAMDIAKRKQYEEIANLLQNPPSRSQAAVLTPNATGSAAGDETDQAAAAAVREDRKSRTSRRSKVKRSSGGKRRPAPADFSPYGCHYYPDLEEFPAPDLGSLPKDPLAPGEQYFLDLAGNIKKV